MTRPQVVIMTGVSVYLLGMAFAYGMAAERIRFDQRRTAVIEACQRHGRHASRMASGPERCYPLAS